MAPGTRRVGSRIIHADARNLPPMIAGGAGVHQTDRSGKRYLDASAGPAVSCLGHGHPEVEAAIRAQLDQIAFAYSGFFTSEAAEELADLLVRLAPGDLDHVFFVSGGSEAIEAALKMSRQHFLELGQPARHRIIARRQSYHGNTLGALAASGNAMRRAPYMPMLAETSHIAPCYEYRDRREDETAEAYGLRVADELEAEIQRLGPETVMAFLAEPIVGATLGCVPAVPGYFRRIREICDRHGVLLILDEVMCGMGRSGTMFACEAEGITPDIVVIAKGLGGGYQPIGALIASGAVYGPIRDGSGSFKHGHTYQSHPVACAAALAVCRVVERDGLAARAGVMGERLRRALEARFGQHPHVGDIRGRGLFLGLELVADRATKAPFAPGEAAHMKMHRAAFEAGVIVYPMGGLIDGISGDHVLLAPPLILEDAHIDEIVEGLAVGLAALG